MNRIFAFLILGSLNYVSLGQIQVVPSISFNSFTMRHMKEIQQDAQSQIPIQTRAVDEFPPFWGFGIDVHTQDDWGGMNVKLGGILQYTSSGGSANVADFSGHLKFDQLVNRLAIGPSVRFLQKNDKKNKLGTELNLLVSFSNLKISSEQKLFDAPSQVQSVKFNSISGQIQLSIVDRYELSSDFFIQLKGGYELDVVSGKLLFKSDSDAWLLTPQGEEARLDWSGLRFSIGIGYTFAR